MILQKGVSHMRMLLTLTYAKLPKTPKTQNNQKNQQKIKDAHHDDGNNDSSLVHLW